MTFSLQNKKVWLTGHTGLVGRALHQKLHSEGCNILTASHTSLDLRNQKDTQDWIEKNNPDAVIIAAATVGGIEANRTRPADFLYDNMMIAANIIHSAVRQNVQKLLYLGSSCIYPREAPVPVKAESLLTGPLESTNEAYALAKIAGIKLCDYYRMQYGCDFISAMPCNLYGIGDRFDLVQSHVIPALMMKFHQAKMHNDASVTVWGSGKPYREFLHADDLAAALVLLLKSYSSPGAVNIGAAQEITIGDLARMMAVVTGFKGEIVFDASRPDGTFRKTMDSSVILSMGWKPEIALQYGLDKVYAWYCGEYLSRAA